MVLQKKGLVDRVSARLKGLGFKAHVLVLAFERRRDISSQ